MIQHPYARKMRVDPLVLGIMLGTFLFWAFVIVMIARLG
jgi:hypothetical protein